MIIEFRKSNEDFKAVHVRDKWIPVEDYTDLSVWPYEAYTIAFFIMSILHVLLLFTTKSLCNRRFRQEPLSFHKILHILSNSILFLPYSQWDDDLHLFSSLHEAWNHTRLEHIIMNLLFGIENAFLCSPLWILLIRINRRDQYLELYFPPLMEEQQSADRTRLLAILAPVFFLIIVPSLQLFLAQLYHYYGHPWSRILRGEITSPISGDTNSELLNPNNQESRVGTNDVVVEAEVDYNKGVKKDSEDGENIGETLKDRENHESIEEIPM